MGNHIKVSPAVFADFPLQILVHERHEIHEKFPSFSVSSVKRKWIGIREICGPKTPFSIDTLQRVTQERLSPLRRAPRSAVTVCGYPRQPHYTAYVDSPKVKGDVPFP